MNKEDPRSNTESHILDEISIYLAGGLDAAERERVDSHIAGCPECGAAMVDAKAMDDSLHTLFDKMSPDRGFEDRLIARFREKTTRRTLHPMVRRAAIGVAASILLGSVGYYAQHNMGRLEQLRTASNLQQIGRAMSPKSANSVSTDSSASTDAVKVIGTQNQSQGEEITYAVNKAVAEARAATARGEYGTADTALQRAAVASRQDPTLFAAGGLRVFDNKIAAAQQANQAARSQAEEAAKHAGDSTTSERLSDEHKIAAEQRRTTITSLRANAIDLTNHKRFREAMNVVDQILQLDPEDDYSAGVRPLLEDQYKFQQHRIFAEAGNHESAGQLARAEEEKIPYDDILRYPTDWPGKKPSDPTGASTLTGRTLTLNGATVSAGTLDKVAIPQRTPAFFDATKAGAGELRLSGQNTYSGGTAVTNGTLMASGAVSGSGKEQQAAGDQKGQDINGDGLATFAFGSNGPAPVAAKPAASPAPQPVIVSEPSTPAAQTATPPATIEHGRDRGEGGKSAENKPLPVGPLNGVTYYAGTMVTDNQSGPVPAAPPAGNTPAARHWENYNTAPSDVLEKVTKTEIAQATPGDSSGTTGKPDDAAKKAPPSGTKSLEPAQDAPAAPRENQIASRKIIREGEMTFEIDSFDSTVMTIGKIVAEEGGFVSTTDSDKLANGKVRGSVVVRIPPEHLDTLVLKLRGIGDLKSQKINAQDITKQYTDLESELRAARAMEDRLLEIIKTGKGAVKDLLEAEKQLGVWREKIEHVEGELRYDNNLISLSTLSITLMERDIKSAAFSSINEQVTMALETEKVEEAYNAAREAIDNAKGRIIQSELKRYDAGQYGGTLRAQLPPDAADAVIGRLRQLDGRLANFQRQRSQSDEGGSAAPLDASKVKHESVMLSLTIYNLANIAPRRTTTLTLAATNVEDAYAAILDQASKAGARVVASNLNRSRPEQSNGTVTLNVPTDKADALLAALRGSGELLGQETNENPDTQNVTTAKRGLIVQVISLASVQARQSEMLQLASPDVPSAFGTILDALRVADARIIASQLNQQDPANKSATIVFDISRTARLPIDATIDKVGEIVSRNITRSQDTANTLESKVHCEMTLQSADVLPARETTTLGMEVPDVQKSVDDLLSAVGELGGREIDKDMSQDPNGKSLAHVIVEVPLDKAGALSERIEHWGHRRVKQVARNPQAPQGKLARGRLEITLADTSASLGGDETTWDAIRHGLAVSGQGLRWSAQMVVVGICFVAPWLLAIWVAWRLFTRSKKRSPSGTGVPPV